MSSDVRSLTDSAKLLAETISTGLRLRLPADFESLFMSHARRLRPELREDYLSLVVIECYENLGSGQEFSSRAFELILDRTRHRMIRGTDHASTADYDSSAPPVLYPESIAAIVGQFIESLSPTQLPVFSLFLDGLEPPEIARQLRISVASCYRTLAEVRHEFTLFVYKLGLND